MLIYDFLSVKNDVNVPSKSKKQKKSFEKIYFLLPFWRTHSKRAGSGAWSVSQRSVSEDPDPYQNVTDPEWIHNVIISNVKILFKETIIAFSLDIIRYRYRYNNFGNTNILPLIILASFRIFLQHSPDTDRLYKKINDAAN